MAASAPSSTFERSKHPLLVLAISTLIGSILVPYFSTRLTEQNRRSELRVSKALEAVRANTLTERQLNTLLNEVVLYARDSVTPDVAARAAFRSRYFDAYAEFDRHAWWWYWPWLQELQILNIVNARETELLIRALTEYTKNLVASLDVMRPIVSASSRKPLTSAERLKAIESMTKQMSALGYQRRDIVQRMVVILREQ